MYHQVSYGFHLPIDITVVVKEGRYLWYIIDLMDDNEVYFSIIVSNLPFDFSLPYDLYHPSIPLHYPVFDGSYRAYDVIDIVSQ